MLGPRLGERARRAMSLEFRHSEPGGEWPHTETNVSPTDVAFLALAEKVDQK